MLQPVLCLNIDKLGIIYGLNTLTGESHWPSISKSYMNLHIYFTSIAIGHARSLIPFLIFGHFLINNFSGLNNRIWESQTI